MDHRQHGLLARLQKKYLKDMKFLQTDVIGRLITFNLCPAEDCKPSVDGSKPMPPGYIGDLEMEQLATPPEATILHLKRFLVAKLLQGERAGPEQVCRAAGFALGGSLKSRMVYPRGSSVGSSSMLVRGAPFNLCLEPSAFGRFAYRVAG